MVRIITNQLNRVIRNLNREVDNQVEKELLKL